MRITRVKKFKRQRLRKNRNLIIFAVILPFTSIFIGYLLTSLIILPVMASK